MKKLTLTLTGIFLFLVSFAQTPQLVPGDYQYATAMNQVALRPGSLGECAGLGNSLIFTTGNELWITDGSVNGTFLLKEFVEHDSLNPTGFAELNGKLYFFADDGTHGNELWATDGTINGTSLLKDINPGAMSAVIVDRLGSGIFKKHKIEVFNGHLYFAADNGTHGIELWKSDGTEQGTGMFQDLNIGSADGMFNARQIVAAGNKLYFVGQKPAPFYGSLFATDGTVSGTALCADSIGILINETMVAFGNKIIFSFTNVTSDTYISDGTEEGTFIIVPGMENANEMAVLNSKAYFFVSQGNINAPHSLMSTDGSIAGTQTVFDIVFGPISIEARKFFFMQQLNGLLYFNGRHDGIDGIWKSDGTISGTSLMDSLGEYRIAYHLTPFNSKLYFKAENATRHDLWYTDGTSAGTQMITMPGVVVNDALAFFSRKYYKYPMVSTGNSLYYYNMYDTAQKVRIYKLDQFPASISGEPEISSIDIYPNPSQVSITIDAEDAKSILIHSIEGKLVYQSDHITATKHTIDTHNLAPGTYAITTLLSDGTKRYGKFIKQ